MIIVDICQTLSYNRTNRNSNREGSKEAGSQEAFSEEAKKLKTD